MSRRTVFLNLAVLAAALQVLWPGVARAHSTNITAAAVCDEASGELVIEYTSTSWSPNPLEGENPQIDILFNNVVVDSGAYVFPGNSFSGSAPAPAGSAAGDGVAVTALAVAPWGNGVAGGQSSSTTVIIPDLSCVEPGTGRFTGGGYQIKVGNVRVTRGLTIHCDLLLSNNLEVNWAGKRFHMTEHLTTVACTDDEDIIQAPPVAPLDTLIGVGTGRYNGKTGYTIQFTLVDGGEPGTNDQASFLIFETANPANVVLDVPLQNLVGGNLQAHFDQPHK